MELFKIFSEEDIKIAMKYLWLEQQLERLYGAELGSLHVDDSWVAWSVCGAPGNETRI